VEYNIAMNRLLCLTALVFLTFGCKQIKDLDPRGDKEHEGKMLKGALKDFWHFSTADDQVANLEPGESPQKDVWSIRDKSSKTRARALVDVDADLLLDEKTMKDKGFRLARHLMIDTRATVVRLRFWSRGFRPEGGMFAELLLSGDGRDWNGSSQGTSRSFRFSPATRPWSKLTKDEIKVLKTLSREKRRAAKRGLKKPYEAALRNTAARTGIEPAKLISLEKSVHRMFAHPRDVPKTAL